jgi:hypothetical protein
MIGPLLIFDKSFVEMLNPEEVSELSMHFKFVGTPTLIGEIIADLKLEPSERRVPSDVVKALGNRPLLLQLAGRGSVGSWPRLS